VSPIQAVAHATADVSATFNACYEAHAISRYKQNVQQTSLENRSTVVLSHKVLDLHDANGDVITNHSEDASCEVFVDADSASDNSSSWSKSESVSHGLRPMLATDKLTKPVIRYQTHQFRLGAFLAQVVVKMGNDDTRSLCVFSKLYVGLCAARIRLRLYKYGIFTETSP
jgi:hypothetical protein